MNLDIAPINWSDRVSLMLEPAMQHEPGVTAATLADLVNSESAELFGVFSDNELVGAYVLRIEQKEAGREGVIVAAGGNLPGFSLIRSILPAIERQFSVFGCNWIRAHSSRPGIIREMSLYGYQQREVVMAKGIQ